MSLGVHFALEAADTARLLAIDDSDELVEFICEERYFEQQREWIYQTD